MDDNQRNNPGPLRRLPDCSPFSRHYQDLEGEHNRDEVLMRIRPLGGELRLDSIDPLAEVDAEDEIADAIRRLTERW